MADAPDRDRPDDDVITSLSRHLGARLGAHRMEADLTQADLARAIAYHRSTVAHAESGNQIPAREFWTACDALLNAGGDLLDLYDQWLAAKRRKAESQKAWDQARRRARAVTIAVSEIGANSGILLSPAAGYQPVLATASGMIERMVAMAADDSARFAQRAEATNVGSTTIEQFRDDIGRIVTIYPSVPLPPVFREVVSLRDRAFELIEGHQHPDQTRDLYLISGVLCAILSNASFDLGAFAPAQTQARTAYLCAELAGSNWLRAWVRGMQALIAYWSDRPAEAVALATSGWTFLPEQGTARVRLAAIEARAHARLADRAGVRDALARARDAIDQATQPDEIAGMFEFPAAKQAFYAATCHLTLGGTDSARQAETLAGQAVDWYQQAPSQRRRVGEQSLARLELATSHIQQHDLASAAEVIRDVLDATRTRRTDSVVRRLDRFTTQLDELATAGEHQAQDLADEIHTALDTTATVDPVVQVLLR